MNKCTRKNDNKWLTSSWKLLIFTSEEIYNSTLISVENITIFLLNKILIILLNEKGGFFLHINWGEVLLRVKYSVFVSIANKL